MKALHIPSQTLFDLTWGCYLRHEDWSLWIAVSYLSGTETQTNEFPVEEESWTILHPDYELLP